ncbi:hypothetical protein Unana1_06117 [Umbelopsis nana]
MVKFFQHTFAYDHPWENVSYAFWLRYPNPFASHVVCADVIDRSINEDGVLTTTRLVLKKGKLPKWFPKHFVKNSEAYVIEESLVDPKSMRMVTRTRNLTHVRIMQVEETQTITPHPVNADMTSVKTEARIISKFGWGMASRIELFGESNFANNAAKARQGMKHILQMIREKHLLRERMSFMQSQTA